MPYCWTMIFVNYNHASMSVLAIGCVANSVTNCGTQIDFDSAVPERVILDVLGETVVHKLFDSDARIVFCADYDCFVVDVFHGNDCVDYDNCWARHLGCDSMKTYVPNVGTG